MSLAKLAALCVCQRSAARCAGHIMIYFCRDTDSKPYDQQCNFAGI
ncbi:hypothetical protein CSB69_1877 [Morganella morganii]|nr:hypothetical protein CSB69_1877 [Morganella morganii]EMP53555.1 hypothetical protein C790_00071 [Morganella morganii SC01]